MSEAVFAGITGVLFLTYFKNRYRKTIQENVAKIIKSDSWDRTVLTRDVPQYRNVSLKINV